MVLRSTLTVLIILLFVACETKINHHLVASIIENDNLIRFEKLATRIDLDTFKFRTDQGKLNVLHYALGIKALKIANKLIDEDFKLDEASDSLNFTPLLLSCNIPGLDDIRDKLIEKNVSLNQVDYVTNLSALHYAVRDNNINLVKKLLAKHADVHIKTHTEPYFTPLDFAIIRKRHDIIKLLLVHRAFDINQNTDYYNDVINLVIESNDSIITHLFYDKMSTSHKQNLFLDIIQNNKINNLSMVDTII